MIHIYYGDGKGKTTAAVGLAIRAIGSGLPVIFAQFLKDDSSSEIKPLRELGVKVFHADTNYGFIWNMTHEQMKSEIQNQNKLFSQIKHVVEEIITEIDKASLCMVILDEIIHSINNNIIDSDVLCDFLDTYGSRCEIVLTGDNPSVEILDHGDYISHICKEKHPFDKGIYGRKGIEF